MSEKGMQENDLQKQDNLLLDMKTIHYKGEIQGKTRSTVHQAAEVFRLLKIKIHEFDCYGIGYLNFKFGEDIIETMKSVITTYDTKGEFAFKRHLRAEINKLAEKKLLLEKELQILNDDIKTLAPEDLRSKCLSQVIATISLLKSRFSSFMKFITAITRVHEDITCILGISVEVYIIKQKYNNVSIALMAHKQALINCPNRTLRAFIKNDIDETIGSLILQCHSVLSYVVKIINETKDFVKERNKSINNDTNRNQCDTLSNITEYLNEEEIRLEFDFLDRGQSLSSFERLKAKMNPDEPRQLCEDDVNAPYNLTPIPPAPPSDLSTESASSISEDTAIAEIEKFKKGEQEDLSQVLKVELEELLKGSSLCEDGKQRIAHELEKLVSAEKVEKPTIINKKRGALLNELRMVNQIRKMEVEVKLKDPLISENERDSYTHELKKINLLIEINKTHPVDNNKKPALTSTFDYGGLGNSKRQSVSELLRGQGVSQSKRCSYLDNRDPTKPPFEPPYSTAAYFKKGRSPEESSGILSDVRKFLHFSGVAFNR